MLKKHNKLIMLLVLVSFMFTMVGSAGAASFSDVSGNDAEASAVYKLNSLGIIDGYPDGTFGPEKTITRAEFAKVAVYMAGLEAVATGLANVPSSFSDVAAGEWYNGWVNVAAAQGFVKGYPDGTFNPNSQIKQAEVITVMLRILGYNDNLTGTWPSNYIAKAANLGVLDDVTFVADKATTRGDVAVMGGETLEKNVVAYKASDNVFEEKTRDDGTGTQVSFSLLSDNFDKANTIKEILVKAVKLANNEIKMDVYDFDPKAATNDYTVTLSKDVVVSGARNIYALDGKMVDYVINDDDEVVYIEVRTDVPSSVFGKLENYSSTARTVEIDDTDYDFADTFFMIKGKFAISLDLDATTSKTTLKSSVLGVAYDAAYAPAAPTGGVYNVWAGNGPIPGMLKDKKATLYFNDDAEIIYIDVAPEDSTYVIDEVKDDYIKTKSGTRITGLDEDDVLIVRNGVPANADDLQENDLIYWIKNAAGDAPRGFDTFLAAVAMPVQGEVTKIKGSKIYIDGNKFGYASPNGKQGLYMEDEDGDKVTNVDDFIGQQITAYIDGYREVAFISGATGEAQGGLAGAVLNTGLDTNKGSNTHWVKLFTEDGTEVTYDLDSDYYDDNDAYTDIGNKDVAQDPGEYIVSDYLGTAGAVNEGQLVKVKLNADGEIKDIDWVDSDNAVTPTTIGQSPAAVGAVYNITDKEKDWDRLNASGYKYVKNDTVIFDMGYTYAGGPGFAITNDDAKMATWDDVEDLGTIYADVYATDDEIDYIVVRNSGGIVSTDIDGVFYAAYKVADDMVDIYVDGELKSYEYDYTSGSTLLQGGIYTFDVNSSNEVGTINPAANTSIGTVQIDGILDGSMSVVIGNVTQETFKTTSDTIFVKVDDDELSIEEYDVIDEGDILFVLEGTVDDVGTAEIVIILDNTADDYAAVKAAAITDLD